MTENNIHKLGNETFRFWYDISSIGKDSRARIAVFPAVFPTLFSAFMPKISPLVSLVEKLWAFSWEQGRKYSGKDCNSCSRIFSKWWDIVPVSQLHYLIYETYIATRKYDPSLDSVNRNTSYELIKVFLKSVGKDIRNRAFFVFFLNLFSFKGPSHCRLRLNQPEPQNCALL